MDKISFPNGSYRFSETQMSFIVNLPYNRLAIELLRIPLPAKSNVLLAFRTFQEFMNLPVRQAICEAGNLNL